MKNHLLNIALNLEMAIAKRQEKRYHSDRSRNKDIIADFKEIIRHEQDTVENEAEALFIYTIGYLLSNTMLDELTNAQIHEVYILVIHFLKQQIDEVEPYEQPEAPTTRTTTTKPNEYKREDFFK